MVGFYPSGVRDFRTVASSRFRHWCAMWNGGRNFVPGLGESVFFLKWTKSHNTTQTDNFVLPFWIAFRGQRKNLVDLNLRPVSFFGNLIHCNLKVTLLMWLNRVRFVGYRKVDTLCVMVHVIFSRSVIQYCRPGWQVVIISVTTGNLSGNWLYKRVTGSKGNTNNLPIILTTLCY